MWVSPVVVVAVAVWALLFSLVATPPVEDVTGRSSIIMVYNQSYHAANVSLTHCTQRPGSVTPYQSFALAGVTFTVRIESCFSPGGSS